MNTHHLSRCSIALLSLALSACAALGGNTCPQVDAKYVDAQGYLTIVKGVTKRCQVHQVEFGVDPTTVVNANAHTTTDLYGNGMYFVYDQQDTLIDYNLDRRSPQSATSPSSPR